MRYALSARGRHGGAGSESQSGNRLRAVKEIPGSIGEEAGSSPMAVSGENIAVVCERVDLHRTRGGIRDPYSDTPYLANI